MTDDLCFVAVNDKASGRNAQQVVYATITLQHNNVTHNQSMYQSID